MRENKLRDGRIFQLLSIKLIKSQNSEKITKYNGFKQDYRVVIISKLNQ